MTDKKELVIRGVVSGPKAMKVLVGNTIAEANGTVFVARIELHEGLNRIPMVAETSAGKRAKKTLKISYKPPSKANATSTQSIFQTSDEPGIPQLTRYEWARQPVARGGVVGLDADGNIYTAAGNAGSTSSDGYLQKYDPEGNELWTREVVSAGQRFDGPLGAAIGSDGSAYVVGTSEGPAEAGIDWGENFDVYISKYSAEGNKLWSRQFGSSSMDEADGVTVDSSGNAYMVGTTRGGLDGEAIVGTSDGFLVKYTPNGTRAWTRHLGSSETGRLKDVAVGDSDNVVVVGEFRGELENTNFVSPDRSMAFVAKYGLGGDLTWLEETQADTSFGFAAEVELGSDEDVYVSGYDPGPNYEYISRFTENGNILWTRYPRFDSCDANYDMAVRPGGGVYAVAESDCEQGVITAYGPGGTEQLYEPFTSGTAASVISDYKDRAYVSGFADEATFGTEIGWYLVKFNPGLELRPVQPPETGTLEVQAIAPENLGIADGTLTPNPFTVSATVHYEGITPIEDASVSLSTSPEGLSIEGDPKVLLGAMNPGEERQVSWQVTAPPLGVERTYELNVVATAAGLSPATFSRQITVPALFTRPDVRPGEGDDQGQPEDKNASGCDPINFVTGNVYEYREDLYVPGRGLPVRFFRFYNSRDPYDGPLGAGWTHTYNASLEENADGSVEEMDPQGKRLVYAKTLTAPTQSRKASTTGLRRTPTARSRSSGRTAGRGGASTRKAPSPRSPTATATPSPSPTTPRGGSPESRTPPAVEPHWNTTIPGASPPSPTRWAT